MDAVCTQLRENGWSWLTNMEDLCRSVYGTDDLRRVELKVGDLPTTFALGNPLESMILHNWMGEAPFSCRRMWWAPLSAGQEVAMVRDSHKPEVSLKLLATGRPLPMRWEPGPHINGPMELDAEVNVVHIQSEQDAGIVVLDNALLLSGSPPRTWTTWQPASWCVDTQDIGMAGVTELQPRTSDWWDGRRAIRATIISNCRGHAEFLSMFDDMQLVPTDIAVRATEEAGVGANKMQRFFDTVPSDATLMRMRSDPRCSNTTSGKPLPSTTFTVLCPRGELLRRMCAEKSLYRSIEATCIHGFGSATSLLLPYGEPKLSVCKSQVLLPGILRRTGCHTIDLHRDPETVGHFIQWVGHSAMDFCNIQELIPILMGSPPIRLRHLLQETETSSVRVCISSGQTVPELHAILCGLFCFLNPLLLLDEVVSLAVAVCILFFEDNRTMSPDHLAVCYRWHDQCWSSTVGKAPTRPLTLRMSRCRRRGYLNTPHCLRLPAVQRAVVVESAPVQKHKKRLSSSTTVTVHQMEEPVTCTRITTVRSTRTVLAFLRRRMSWGKRLNRYH